MGSDMPAEPTAFLSHASADAPLAMQLCNTLESRGVRCWIAPRNIPPSVSWPSAVLAGLEGCGAFVLLVTTNALLSEEVLTEVEKARRLKRQVYSVMVDKPELVGELRYYLTRWQWIDAAAVDMDRVGTQLAEVLQGTRQWNEVTTPLSWRQRIALMLPSFTGSLLAVFAVLLLLGGLAWYAGSRVRNTVRADAHNLAWTTMDTAPSVTSSGTEAVGHVWLGATGVLFSQIRLFARVTSAAGAVQTLDLTSDLPAEGTMEAEFGVPISPQVSALTTFLTVPQSDKRFCIMQQYTVRPNELLRTGEPKVTKISGEGSCH